MSEESTAEIVHLKKYANRRYYDAANSRHLKLSEIHQLVKSGRSVVVTDGQTGADITSEVLLGILLEFEPQKAAALPESILTWWIRTEAEKLREIAAETADPLWKALSDFQQQLQAEMKTVPAMQQILPAVKGLAKEIVKPLKNPAPATEQKASTSDKPASAQTRPNEDLEDLIRAFDAGAFKIT